MTRQRVWISEGGKYASGHRRQPNERPSSCPPKSAFAQQIGNRNFYYELHGCASFGTED
jgi:hypothetical protein